MELKRKSFQGVFNIIRFNRHFYLIAALVLISVIVFHNYLPETIRPLAFWLSFLAILAITFSLIISFYVYDISDLYRLNWLPDFNDKKVLNINAGFDETSEIIKNKFPNCTLTVCDFYDPQRHTETSIKRARKDYPPFENTIQVATNKLPFSNDTFDYSVAILSAHEIRDINERISFFEELNRVTKSNGQLFVTEHLRDMNNFIAYTIGFFHFHSKSSWRTVFRKANLTIKQEIKTTPFITTFVLQRNGDSF